MPLRRLKKNPPPSLHERRRYARAQNSLAIKLEDKDVDFVTETKNISCIGAYCQIDGYLPILTKLKITLLLPKTRGLKAPQHITCEVTVVRIEKCHVRKSGLGLLVEVHIEVDGELSVRQGHELAHDRGM